MLKILLLSIRNTWLNFTIAKLRTFLTIFGIIIGISSIFIVMSIGSSAQNVLLDQIRSVGSNIISVLPGTSKNNELPPSALGIEVISLYNDDLKILQTKEIFPHIEAVSGYISTNKVLTLKNKRRSVTLQGVSSGMKEVENIDLKYGRFLTSHEDEKGYRVIVLGSKISKELFDDANPINKTIHIDKKLFRIVGVIKKRGSFMSTNLDNTAYIPLTTAQNTILGVNYLDFIRLKISDEKYITQIEKEIEKKLKNNHDIKNEEDADFRVRNTASVLETLSDVTNVLKYFLASVAGISLIVGGIGVMNIMFITLHRRIQEIGLRKSLGARSVDIISQFLVESITISTLGGLIGILIGVIVSYVISIIAKNSIQDWSLVLDWKIFAVSIGVAFLVGLLFGIYPAIKASRISPIEALRYE